MELPAEKLAHYVDLQPALVRNQELAKNAIKGMRSALVRVREILDVRAVLKTYDSTGQKNNFAAKAGKTLSKRS